MLMFSKGLNGTLLVGLILKFGIDIGSKTLQAIGFGSISLLNQALKSLWALKGGS